MSAQVERSRKVLRRRDKIVGLRRAAERRLRLSNSCSHSAVKPFAARMTTAPATRNTLAQPPATRWQRYCPACCLIVSSTCALTASRLKNVRDCIGETPARSAPVGNALLHRHKAPELTRIEVVHLLTAEAARPRLRSPAPVAGPHWEFPPGKTLARPETGPAFWATMANSRDREFSRIRESGT